MTNTGLRLASFAVAVALLSSTADAALYGTISGNFDRYSVSPSGGVTASLSGSSPLANPNAASAGTDAGGLFKFNTTGGSLLSFLPSTLPTFCLEIPEHINLSSTFNYDVQNLADAPVGTTPSSSMTGTAVGLIDRLFDKYYVAPSVSLMSSTDQAAFQLALWKLEYDYPSTPTSIALNDVNGFNAAGQGWLTVGMGSNLTILNAAIGMINTVTSAATIADKYTLFSLTNDQKQDQVIAFLNPDVPPHLVVPEPSSMILWGALGLVGCVFARRRRSA